MDLLSKIENKARKAAQLIELEVSYHPGETESDDLFEAYNKGMNISIMGPTREKAIAAAREDIFGQLMGDSRAVEAILAKPSKK